MYARRVLGERADGAEDVVQEAYLRLLALAANDDAPESARPWLFRVVRNLAIDERRSAARRATPTAALDELASIYSDDTAAIAERNHELAGALASVAALPPQERRAIEMDQAGIGAQRIAAELDTTPNAVHQALFRARRRLRNARAVAWGLIPVGAIPFALRLSDPALAASIGNLPPGMPVGRALPVAGIVAAAMVTGTAVVPTLDTSPPKQPIPAAFIPSVPVSAAPATPLSSPATPVGVQSALGRSTAGDDRSDARGDGSAADDRNDFSNLGRGSGSDDDDSRDDSDRRDNDSSSDQNESSDDRRDDDERSGRDEESRRDDRSGPDDGDSDDRSGTRSDKSSATTKKASGEKKKKKTSGGKKKAKRSTKTPRVTPPPVATKDEDDDSSGSGSGGSSSSSGSGGDKDDETDRD